MPETTIDDSELLDLRRRFARFPAEYRRASKKASEATLLQVWESVPGYPPSLPHFSHMRRGTLGRSIGVSVGGGRFGRPGVYEVRLGPNFVKARFGAGNIAPYAKYVIGKTEQRNHPSFKRWWDFKKLRELAMPKIKRTAQILVEELANFLAGKGGGLF